MRVGGLASGMDIDELVNKLMTAERIPLNKMQQKQTTLTWQRDAFRDVNKELKELDDMMLDMKLSKTYNTKKVSSTNESAVTATGDAGSANGSYEITVNHLASSAVNVSQEELTIDPNKTLKEQDINFGPIKFSTFDTKKRKMVDHEVKVNEDDTLNNVLSKFNKEDKNVRAFYDSQSNKVFIETTRTGNYNKDGDEIVFSEDSSSFTGSLKLTGKEIGGNDSSFNYNGIEMTAKDNSYKMNGITFQFKGVTNGSATLTVNNDVDAAFDNIKKFVDKYNEVVEKLNGSQTEDKYRNYQPLTEEQKKGMSDKEVELWEKKAKSGIIKGEGIISSGLYSMRQSWYGTVKNDGPFSSITELGIKTTKNYLDGGKLEIDEKKLKEKLREDPDGVQKMFSNSSEEQGRGIVNRLRDSVESTVKKIEERAGKSSSTLENYTIGKNMKDLNTRISDFQRRLQDIETRYWNQFTAMEKAISNMNSQSEQLFSQFGGQ